MAEIPLHPTKTKAHHMKRSLASAVLAATLLTTMSGKTQTSPDHNWATPSTIRSRTESLLLKKPQYPVRLKWVAEIIPGDKQKLQAIISSEDGQNIDIVYHYNKKQRTRIPTTEIIEWGITNNGSIGPGPMAPFVIPFALILGVGETQQFSFYVMFIDGDGKPFQLIFDPYDNGKLLASLLRFSTGLEPSEKRSNDYIESIRASRSVRAPEKAEDSTDKSR